MISLKKTENREGCERYEGWVSSRVFRKIQNVSERERQLEFAKWQLFLQGLG